MLNDISADLKKNNPEVKWVDTRLMHITLHFICYLDASLLAQVKGAARRASSAMAPAVIRMEKIGYFPDDKHPRAIHVTCSQKEGRSLFELQKILGDDLEKIGIQLDRRPWTPHITLGRAKSGWQPADIDFNFKGREFSVTRLDLMESVLHADGPEYKIIESFNFPL